MQPGQNVRGSIEPAEPVQSLLPAGAPWRCPEQVPCRQEGHLHITHTPTPRQSHKGRVIWGFSNHGTENWKLKEGIAIPVSCFLSQAQTAQQEGRITIFVWFQIFYLWWRVVKGYFGQLIICLEVVCQISVNFFKQVTLKMPKMYQYRTGTGLQKGTQNPEFIFLLLMLFLKEWLRLSFGWGTWCCKGTCIMSVTFLVTAVLSKIKRNK